MIFDIIMIILGLLVIFEWLYTLMTERKHSNKIQDVRDYYRDMRDKQYVIEDKVENLKYDLKHTDRRVKNLYDNMEALFEALHMQGIATDVKTEEVKVLVKPEDTDGEDTDN